MEDIIQETELAMTRRYWNRNIKRFRSWNNGWEFKRVYNYSNRRPSCPKRRPFGRTIGNSTKIAFILDFNPDMKTLTDTDMYRTQNSNHPMQFVLNLLESYKGEKNGRVSAIPYGVPSSFISEIIVFLILLC